MFFGKNGRVGEGSGGVGGIKRNGWAGESTAVYHEKGGKEKRGVWFCKNNPLEKSQGGTKSKK